MPDGNNAFRFEPAIRVNTAIVMALAGASGSGKTKSALELAVGLASPKGKILIVDSEGGRAKHYADEYQFYHHDWRPPYSPKALGEILQEGERQGFSVIIVDSMSSEHEDEGGLCDMAEAAFESQRGENRNSAAAWAKPKAEHKRNIVRWLRQCRCHVIFCLRATEKVRFEKVDGRTKVVPIGWTPIAEKNLLYDVTTSLLFTPEKPGIPQPIKLYDKHRQFFPLDRRVTREAGRALAEWSAGGAPAPTHEPTIEDHARAAAENGKAALDAFWKGLSRDARAKIVHLIVVDKKPGELARRAAEVDASRVGGEPPDEIPFEGADPAPAPDHREEDPFDLPSLPDRAAQAEPEFLAGTASDSKKGGAFGGPEPAPAGEPTLAEIIAAEIAAAATEADVTAIEIRHRRALDKMPHPEWLPLKEQIDQRRAELAAAPQQQMAV